MERSFHSSWPSWPKGATMRTLRIALALLAVSGFLNSASAGPPFATDDPQPTDTGHWEIYAFASGVHTPGETQGQTGLDLNYGGAKDLQLTLNLPLAFSGGTTGLGDIELAAKYRFLHQAPGTLTPDLAFFPRIYAATAPRRFGDGHSSLLLPIWAQKDIGPWSVFGGGGYQIHPGARGLNSWQSGAAVLYQATQPLAIGVELFHQSRDARDSQSFTQANLGALYRLSPHWSLLGEVGPGLDHVREEGRYNFYLSLKADY